MKTLVEIVSVLSATALVVFIGCRAQTPAEKVSTVRTILADVSTGVVVAAQACSAASDAEPDATVALSIVNDCQAALGPVKDALLISAAELDSLPDGGSANPACVGLLAVNALQQVLPILAKEGITVPPEVSVAIATGDVLLSLAGSNCTPPSLDASAE